MANTDSGKYVLLVEDDPDIRELVLEDPAIAEHMSGEELRRVFDLGTQLRNVDRIFERVLGATTA